MSSYIALQRVVLCPPSAFPPEKQHELGEAPTVADVWLLCSGYCAVAPFKMLSFGKFFGLSEKIFGLSEKYCPCPPPQKKPTPKQNMGPTAPLLLCKVLLASGEKQKKIKLHHYSWLRSRVVADWSPVAHSTLNDGNPLGYSHGAIRLFPPTRKRLRSKLGLWEESGVVELKFM